LLQEYLGNANDAISKILKCALSCNGFPSLVPNTALGRVAFVLNLTIEQYLLRNPNKSSGVSVSIDTESVLLLHSLAKWSAAIAQLKLQYFEVQIILVQLLISTKGSI
jgi:hypothetical protein